VGAAAGGITLDATTMSGAFEDVYDGSLLSGIRSAPSSGSAASSPMFKRRKCSNTRRRAGLVGSLSNLQRRRS